MRIVSIGHSTLLVDMDGVRILTDPNFDFWLGGLPRVGGILSRVTAPGMALKQLPPLDAILASHAHVDHLSLRSLGELPLSTPIFAPPAVSRWLRRCGRPNARPLGPGDSISIDNRAGGVVRITAAAARHYGCRHVIDWWSAGVNMYLLESSTETCVFAGDTGPRAPGERTIIDRLREGGRALDLALLPINHAPWWEPGFARGHLRPRDALQACERLAARWFVPHHWGTFNFVDSGAFDAITRLRRALETTGTSVMVRILEPGESLTLEPQARDAAAVTASAPAPRLAPAIVPEVSTADRDAIRIG